MILFEPTPVPMNKGIVISYKIYKYLPPDLVVDLLNMIEESRN